jgi:hypothetical protein
MNNQIRLPVPIINFPVDVGLTGQDHDNYAQPGTHPRYDWMRSILLGLLSNQASYDEPTQYRPGTIWFKLTDLMFRSMKDGRFGDISECIKAPTDQSLYDWAEDIDEKRNKYIQTGTFSGISHHQLSVIRIPEELQPISKAPNRPYLFKAGLLANPSLVRFGIGCPVSIELSGDAILSSGDNYTIFIR